MANKQKLREVMTRKVETVRPEDTLATCADKMRRLDVGTMPVCDGERVLGMITDRDITVRATADGLDPNRTQVEQVMSAEVIWCFEDETVADATRKMSDRQIRRLLVMSRDKRLVGVVSLGDLALETDAERAGDVLQDISQPNRQ